MVTTDLETQLGRLGRDWSDRLVPVSSTEIVERAASGADADPAGATVRSSPPANSDRRSTWPIAVAAVLVLVLVGALTAVVTRSGDTDRVTDDSARLVERDDVDLRWSATVPAAGDELVPLGPVALGDDVVVVAVQNRVTALDLVDGTIRWQREFDDAGPFGAIVDLTAFGETAVFSVGPRTEGAESEPAAVGLSMADGTEQWRVSGGQAYSVLDGAVYEFEGLGGDDMSFRLVDARNGSYLTDALRVGRRDDVTTVGSLTIVESDTGEPALYDTDRRIQIAFPSELGGGATTLAPAGPGSVAVRAEEVVLHDDRGEAIDRVALPEIVHDAPWITAFPHLELVVVSTGDGSVGIDVDGGRLAVRWESDAAVNSSAFDPTIAIEAASPLALTAGDGFTEPGGVIDLDSGDVHPFDGEPIWASVARDGYAVMTAGPDDADTLRAHTRDGTPTWTLDVPDATDEVEQSVLGDDVFVLVSVTRSEDGTGLTVTTYG
jgi:hypothetical protein